MGTYVKASALLGSVFGGLLAAVDISSGQGWVQLPNSPGQLWSVALSADGTTMALGSGLANPVYISTNSGATWATNFQSYDSGTWRVASSADGTRLAAAVGHPLSGPILISADSGATWTTSNVPSLMWHHLACSPDGTKLAGAAASTEVYTSSDSGADWMGSATTPFELWMGVALSADGTKLAAVWAGNSDGGLYTSLDSGATWAPNAVPDIDWFGVACSADGTRWIAVSDQGLILTSTDSGSNWRTNTPIADWWDVTSSADGTKLAVLGHSGLIYLSTNSGASWFDSGAPAINWVALASSADGNKLVAVEYNGSAYVRQTTPVPVLDLAPSGANLKVSWIVPSAPFQLQRAANLIGTGWLAVAEQPVLNYTNLHYEITISPSNSSGFYRLAGP